MPTTKEMGDSEKRLRNNLHLKVAVLFSFIFLLNRSITKAHPASTNIGKKL